MSNAVSKEAGDLVGDGDCRIYSRLFEGTLKKGGSKFHGAWSPLSLKLCFPWRNERRSNVVSYQVVRRVT